MPLQAHLSCLPLILVLVGRSKNAHYLHTCLKSILVSGFSVTGCGGLTYSGLTTSFVYFKMPTACAIPIIASSRKSSTLLHAYLTVSSPSYIYSV
ncbi:hypothetical protein F5Y19DRAFT_142850 [Xylariaceae sp. FL1651]|nr:hypothetical protein F5Y19DRAFT_142850 [Xylariaceae sp. FL1651]